MQRNCLRWFAVLVGFVAVLGRFGLASQDNPTAPAQDNPKAKETKTEAPAVPPASDDIPAPRRDLASRLHFVESYQTVPRDKARGLVQYQVAFRETMNTMQEVAQAAPKTGSYSWTGRFTERAAELSLVDNRLVSAVVRHYEDAAVTPNPWAAAGYPTLAKDLTLWIKDLGGFEPKLIMLPSGGSQAVSRPFFEQEFKLAAGSPYFPMLAMVLPDRFVHIGDSWPVARVAANTLVNDIVVSGTLTAKLSKVEPVSDPNYPDANERAFIDVEGRLQTAKGQTGLRARIEFTFREVLPSAPAVEAPVENPGADPSKKTESAPAQPAIAGSAGPICVGGISKIRLAQVKTFDKPGPNQPNQIRRDWVVERIWPAGTSLLTIPEPAPEATPENSWLTHLDPKLLFSIKHPPDFVPQSFPTDDGGEVFVLDHAQFGGAIEHIELVVRAGEPPKPEVAFKQEIDEARQVGHDAVEPEIKLLPPAEWSDRQVYRVETVFTPQNDLPPAGRKQAARTHFDGYVMMLPENYSATATARTTSDDAVPFRKSVEEILKTFVLHPQLQPPTQNLPR